MATKMSGWRRSFYVAFAKTFILESVTQECEKFKVLGNILRSFKLKQWNMTQVA